ncbi:MAG: Uma2 family endonuclease [Spirulina sp. SIO3F2]|nr:Uma2 family endonuclease [Spirulina sp. SIO3F2]
MTLARQRYALADYFSYDADNNTKYELVAGEIVPMSLGSGRHGEIMHQLGRYFEQQIVALGQAWVARQGMIGVQSPQRGQWETVRIPDVVVLPQNQWREIRDREAVVLLSEPAPIVVAEVVSPSTRSTDYRAKRTEYALLGIGEYWVVDALAEQVMICTLVEGFYDTVELKGEQLARSALFPQGNLSVEQLLNP